MLHTVDIAAQCTHVVQSTSCVLQGFPESASNQKREAGCSQGVSHRQLVHYAAGQQYTASLRTTLCGIDQKYRVLGPQCCCSTEGTNLNARLYHSAQAALVKAARAGCVD
jgi:hypothetical protein